MNGSKGRQNGKRRHDGLPRCSMRSHSDEHRVSARSHGWVCDAADGSWYIRATFGVVNAVSLLAIGFQGDPNGMWAKSTQQNPYIHVHVQHCALCRRYVNSFWVSFSMCLLSPHFFFLRIPSLLKLFRKKVYASKTSLEARCCSLFSLFASRKSQE